METGGGAVGTGKRKGITTLLLKKEEEEQLQLILTLPVLT